MDAQAVPDILDKITNKFTKIIPRNILENYDNLSLSKNGTGDRWANKKYNYSVIYANKSIKLYSENDDDVIPADIYQDFSNMYKTKARGKTIIGLFVHSHRQNIVTRPIHTKISKIIKQQSCISCGSNSSIICDHKNDLYNDPRVLDVQTQNINDFQPLCLHCNLQKRQICKREQETNKLYSAKNIHKYKIFPFEFPWEKIAYDKNYIHTKSASYWHDPMEFNNKIYLYMMYKLPIITALKYKYKL